MTSTSTDLIDGVSTSTATKPPCRGVLTTLPTLSGEQTLGGVAYVADNRVLIAVAGGSVYNGIWVVSTTAWTRAVDFDGTRDVKRGTIILVAPDSGTSQFWEVKTTGTITPGTTVVEIEQWHQTVINETGADVDFRVEGDTDANLLFVDASTDMVGIGTATPTVKLDVSGAVKVGGALTVTGNTTLGDADTDTVTTNGNVTLNAAASGDALTVNGARSIAITQGARFGVALNDTFTLDTKTLSHYALGWDLLSSIDGTNAAMWLSGFGGVGFCTGGLKSFAITTDGRIYGTALHNNAGALTGTTNQYFGHSLTATPTLTNVANSSSLSGTLHAVRNGNIVSWTLNAAITVTSATTKTQFRVSIPIASTLAATADVKGSGAAESSSAVMAATVTGYVSGGATDILITFYSGSATGAHTVTAAGTYEVL